MRDLWTRARAGDKVARDELVERHMPLARSLAIQYRHAREPFGAHRPGAEPRHGQAGGPIDPGSGRAITT